MMQSQGLYDPRYEHDACGVGFLVDMKGRKSHAIVQQGLQVLINLAHRGACGCEENTGDGAGIMVQTPDKFLRKVAPAPLPPAGEYGVGLVFMPHDAAARETITEIFARIIAEEGQTLLGWRDVPTDDSLVGPSAVAVEPLFAQIFISGSPSSVYVHRFFAGSVSSVVSRRYKNVAAVALANKNARIVWALQAHDPELMTDLRRALSIARGGA